MKKMFQKTTPLKQTTLKNRRSSQEPLESIPILNFSEENPTEQKKNDLNINQTNQLSSTSEAKIKNTNFSNFFLHLIEIEEEEEEKQVIFDNLSIENDEGISKIIKSMYKLETLIWFGVGLCADQVLTCLTILPLRILYRFFILSTPNQKFIFDLACFSIFIFTLIFLVSFVGAAQVYHSIRLQTFMKLYVVVNISEVLDRLLSSLGLDLFELLAETNPKTNLLKFLLRYSLCLMYSCLHSILFYVRLLTLSVAVNSSNDALFTILVSNNFVELKGSVFKKSSEQNLFQISCSDIVERFVLIVFMLLVGFNEYETNTTSSGSTLFFGLTILVLLVEVVVDWIKHMFIVRFNSDIQAREAYGRFLIVLCEDFQGKSTLVEKNKMNVFPAVPQRLGLPILPIACVIIRVIVFDVSDVFYERSWSFVLGVWFFGLCCKLLLKLALDRWTLFLSLENGYLDKSPPSTPTPSTPILVEPQTLILQTILQTPNNPIITRVPNSSGSHRSHKRSPQKSLSKVNRFENG